MLLPTRPATVAQCSIGSLVPLDSAMHQTAVALDHDVDPQGSDWANANDTVRFVGPRFSPETVSALPPVIGMLNRLTNDNTGESKLKPPEVAVPTWALTVLVMLVICASPTALGMRQVRAVDVLHAVVLHESTPVDRVGEESRSRKLRPKMVESGLEVTAALSGTFHESIGES